MFAIQDAIIESAIVALATEPAIGQVVEIIENLFCSRAETEPHAFPNGLFGLRTSFEITMVAPSDKGSAVIHEAGELMTALLAEDRLRAGDGYVVIDCVLERASVEAGRNGNPSVVRAAFIALTIED